MAFYVYILQSESSGRFYTGHTRDLAERVSYHNSNYSRSLKHRGPWNLVHKEEFATRAEAMRRERQIKSWKDRAMVQRLVSASR